MHFCILQLSKKTNPKTKLCDHHNCDLETQRLQLNKMRFQKPTEQQSVMRDTNLAVNGAT